MADREAEDHDLEPVVLPQLRAVLSPGYEAAQAELDAMFRAARERFPGNPYVAGLEEWLSTVLAAEYFGRTPPAPERARPRRRTGPGRTRGSGT